MTDVGHMLYRRGSSRPADTSAIVEGDQFRDAGEALTAFDFDHHVIVDP